MAVQTQLKEQLVDVEAELEKITRMPHVRLEEGWRIIDEIHNAVIANGTPEMTMDEINAEIAACRKEWREREPLLLRESQD